MSAKGWPWIVLDLPRAPATTAEVRRAYAKRLKSIDQATDIAGFAALREAYEVALARVDQKARKATPLVLPEPVLAEDIPLPPEAIAADPVAPLQEAPATPAFPTEAGPVKVDPPPPPIQSPEDRLRIRFGLLAERNILLSPSAQVQAILDEPEFQSPDLAPLMRGGMADYIRSQMLTDHLGEPYLRHPGVTAELLKTLDARFGWLSDYSAFRRDFWNDTHILEAMVDAAGIDRTLPPASVKPAKRPIFEGYIVPYSGVLLIGFMVLLRNVLEAGKDSPDSSALHILSEILIGVMVVGLAAIGGFILYESIRAHFSHRTAILGCVWAGLGAFAVALSNGMVPGIPVVPRAFGAWGSITFASALGGSVWWLFANAAHLLARFRKRN